MKLKTLTYLDVENLADTILVFQRGQAYLASGAVLKFRLDSGGKSIQARVAGSGDIYQVEIAEVGADLEIDCTCPYDGYICKHAVSVLLYYLKERSANSFTDEAQGQASQTNVVSALGKTLESMEHIQLVELLLRLSEQSDAFRRTLLENITIPKQVIRQQPSNPTGLRRLMHEITHYFSQLPQTLDEYYESEELDEIDDFFEQIGTFNPNDQLELLIHLVGAGNDVMEEYPINAVQIGRALTFYGEAAALIFPSPKEKQDHFDWLLNTLSTLEIWEYGAEKEDLKAGLDALATTPADYTYLLKQFKKLAEEYPVVTDWIANYYLKLGDDLNYLAIRQANLVSEAHYLQLADYWRSKGNEAKYLETLESWLVRLEEDKTQQRSTPFSYSSLQGSGSILERLVEYYLKYHDDENLLRILLAQVNYLRPTLELYRKVKDLAERLHNWQIVRKQFIELINPYDQRTLAEIHLYEKDWQAAIDLARQQTGYGQEDIKTLVARGVQQYRPEVAIELYMSLVDFNIERANRKYYQEGARYAALIKGVYLEILKDPIGWQHYISKIRSVNSRRPALQDEFKAL
ncbi:MAG: SWIM zinc finger family protein [Chloroflexi bacterium]|uniref:SWIM zinc finger family protein n=1 Tax=Candidatus Chlorohelix allophototropha TaxID=3003348 RepID=A0A8T7LZE1_9CHLR|nr:SWIM zinc finger family protein [Chloroflexota bacterium]WJW65757.1 SWIM zinc finger family protein [Chloroflexota bacterium L227-S17]